jgi:hypothetical protein
MSFRISYRCGKASLSAGQRGADRGKFGFKFANPVEEGVFLSHLNFARGRNLPALEVLGRSEVTNRLPEWMLLAGEEFGGLGSFFKLGN